MKNWVFVLNFEALILRIVTVCFILWAPILLFSYRLAFIPYILMCLITIPVHKFKTLERAHLPMIGMIIFFVVWCGISVFWAMDRRFSANEFFKIAPILLGSISLFCYFKTLSVEQIRKCVHAFLGGVIFTFYLMLVDHFLGFELAKWKKWTPPSMAKTYQFSILILVLSLGLCLSQMRMRRWIFIPSTFLGILLLYVFSKHYDYDAGPISLFLFGVTFILVLILPRVIPVLIRYSLVLLLLTAPILVHTFLTPPIWQAVLKSGMSESHLQRIELVEWGVNLIYSKPLVGYGLGQVRALGTISRPRDYSHYSGWTNMGVRESDISQYLNKKGEDLIDPSTGSPPLYWVAKASHLHNGFMQIWVELGAIGVMLIAVFLFLGLKGMESFRVSRYQRAFFYSFLSSLLLIFSVSFGVWETWWLSTIVVLIFLYYLNFRIHESRSCS